MTDLLGLYVHIPFCSVKCFYCDFTAFAHQGKQADRYLKALEAEAKTKARRPDTVYVGGGTPSELTAPQIRELFALLKRAYPGLRPIETTFEANPESLTPEKLEALAEAGVDRLSLGLQTSDDTLLKEIGRRHTRADFYEVYKTARSMGCFAISIDLMYGLPGQSLASHAESLGYVMALDPEHVSVYGLQVEDRTLFSKRGVEVDEDLGRRMFELTLETLGAHDYRHYEISNFARPGRQSAHNLNYWRNGEYIGIGCGAAGYLDGARAMNPDRLNDYLDGRPPTIEILAGKEKLGESMMLGLRLIDGFAPTGPMWQAFEPEIESLKRRGLIERHGARLRLTREGVFLANDVFKEFVAPFAEALI